MKSATLALLTPMRGFAALIVVLHHGAVGGPIPRGYLAVDFFFMLSGLVLAHVHGERFAQKPVPGAVRRFLWLRLCRVYPVHFAITLCLVPAGRHCSGVLAVRPCEQLAAYASLSAACIVQ